MPQSLAQIYLHVVFSTKGRAPFLNDDSLRADVHAYLAGICRNTDSPSIIVGGTSDHVHILCYLSKTQTVADLVREIKRESSKWIKVKASDLSAFHWQNGYGAFSISPSHIELVRNYIQNQREHHREESFQDEFRRLLKKYGMDCDERYVWD